MAPDKVDSAVVGKAVALVQWLQAKAIEGVPPLKGAAELAAEYAGDPSYATTEQRIRALVRWEATKNFASGFVTGLGGVLTLPVAVPAALGASWLLQARLAAAIAALHGHSLDEDRVLTMVLLAVIGDSAGGVVKSAGIVVGRRLTANAIRAVPGRVLIEINKRVGLRLLTKAGQKGVVNLVRVVPLAGGAVGGGVDAAVCLAVGKAADRLFAPERTRKRSAGAGRPGRVAARRRVGKRPVSAANRRTSSKKRARGTGRRS